MGYIGTDFPLTQPGTERVYTIDFIQQIAIQTAVSATIGGIVTGGDLVGITFNNLSLPDGNLTLFYAVQTDDTISTIAAALEALVNGNQALTILGISASSVTDGLLITYPSQLSVVMQSYLAPVYGNQFATETLEFANQAYSGEVIETATCLVESFDGPIDPAPSTRILGGPTIAGSKVCYLLGNFIAGINYRITYTVSTYQQPAIILYSHLLCELPE